MAILGKQLAGPVNTVIYTVPTGKQATVVVNAVNVLDQNNEVTISLVKTRDKTIAGLNLVNGGSGFTSIPTLTINGDNTTQAEAIVNTVKVTGIAVASGGIGYFPGNVLTISGGTFSAPVRVTVLTADGVSGAIQSVAITEEGSYSDVPTSPAGHTGGQGSGATFNLTYTIETVSVTIPGNGYDTATISASGAGTGYSITPIYGVAAEVTDAIEWKTPLSARAVLERTGIPLAAGEMIAVNAGLYNSVNVTVYGIEDLA